MKKGDQKNQIKNEIMQEQVKLKHKQFFFSCFPLIKTKILHVFMLYIQFELHEEMFCTILLPKLITRLEIRNKKLLSVFKFQDGV
jgi:hypothetical protein